MKSTVKKINPCITTLSFLTLFVLFAFVMTQGSKVQADSVNIKNQVNSSANSGNKDSSKNNSEDINTGQAKSESSIQIDLNKDSKGNIEIKEESRANQTESKIELNEKIENLPPHFQQIEEQTTRKENEKTKVELNIKKETENNPPTTSASDSNYFEQLKKGLLSLLEDATSTISKFFS
jgi:hypothetical protein